MSAAHILLELFDHVKDDLPAKQLDHIAALASSVEVQAVNLATTLSALALLHDESNQTNMPDIDDMGKILFGLAFQAETIGVLATIGNEASVSARLKKEASNGQ